MSYLIFLLVLLVFFRNCYDFCLRFVFLLLNLCILSRFFYLLFSFEVKFVLCSFFKLMFRFLLLDLIFVYFFSEFFFVSKFVNMNNFEVLVPTN